MFSLFKRLFKTAEAEANSAIDKIQDPIKMTEQAIRDLKKDLSSSLESLAEIKAINISNIRRKEELSNNAKDYENKAMLLLKRAKEGNLEMTEAEKLATEALNRKEQLTKETSALNLEIENQKKTINSLEVKIRQLQAHIRKWESEAVILKARAKTAKANKKINQHLAKIDSDGTISMLEKMKERVSKEESLAQAFGELETNVDKQIDQALQSEPREEASRSLAEMKQKLGIS